MTVERFPRVVPAALMAAGIGLWDKANNKYLLPGPTADATHPGGSGTAVNPAAFFNVAFRLSEPMPVIGDPAGMHLTAVGKKLRDARIAERAAAQDLWTMPLSACYLGPATRQGFVLGYGGVRPPDLATAVRRRHPRLPVVFFSGSADNGNHDRDSHFWFVNKRHGLTALLAVTAEATAPPAGARIEAS